MSLVGCNAGPILRWRDATIFRSAAIATTITLDHARSRTITLRAGGTAAPRPVVTWSSRGNFARIQAVVSDWTILIASSAVIRWPCVLAVLGACGGNGLPPVAGGVSLVLDIPNGPLDPKGFASVEVILHEPSGDVTRSTDMSPDGTFDLGAIDPTNSVSIEATLRNDSGAAVGYGRTAISVAFAAGTEIVVPVRRPIAYIAGTVSRDRDDNGSTPELDWTEAPATFSDLSVGTRLDGTAQIGSQAVLVIAAGPSLYLITQDIDKPSGELTGPAKIVPVSAADHQTGTALGGSMTGAVIDGAGSDDGSTLVIGTATQLFAVDTALGTVRPLAEGSFARVALRTTDTGGLDAIAIKNRGATTGPCQASAELWWAKLSGDDAGPAQLIATGGFSDIAADRGHAYYVDACTGELGEITAAGITKLWTVVADPTTTQATALAVSNGKAYVGFETAPATTALIVASLTTGESRTLWNENAQQVVNASDFEGVQRQLDAASAVFNHLEVGAGGDYVALTTSAHFDGAAVPAASFPAMTIDTEELRVFDASTGGIVQRYRSWCDGVLNEGRNDIQSWECASTAGQTEAADADLEHHIGSMTFTFGKK